MNEKGLTLIELVVAIAMLAILAAIAMPNMTDLMQRNQVAAEVNRLVSDLLLARNTAVTRQSVVTVCRSADGQNCLGNAANAFEDGWLTYTADDPRVAFGSGADDELLKVGDKSSVNMQIRTQGNQAPDYVSFMPDGRISTANPGNVVFTVCFDGESTQQVPGKRVTISVSGRPNTREMPVGACS